MEPYLKENASACLWMQAGVVENKPCFREFACADCRFDRALARVCRDNQAAKKNNTPVQGKKGRLVFWQDKLKMQPLTRRPCIHHMKGHISFKACPKAYHCVDCEFDQFFHDQFKVHTMVKSVKFDDISGIRLPSGYYLSRNHTWIRIEGDGMVRMGIDDFAAKLLGGFDTLEAPLMGKKLARGKSGFSLSRQGNQVNFPSPVNGVITGVNARARKSPDIIEDSPYQDGWLLTLYCPELKQDLKQLMFMETAREFMNSSVTHLYEFLEVHTRLKAADGGSLAPDIYGHLPGISWEELVKTFIL